MRESILPSGVSIADSVAEFIKKGGRISELPPSYHIDNEHIISHFTFGLFTDNFLDDEVRDPIAAAKKLLNFFPLKKSEEAVRLRVTGGVPHANHAAVIEEMSLEDLVISSKGFVQDFLRSSRIRPFDHPVSVSAAKQADRWLGFYTVAAIAVHMTR